MMLESIYGLPITYEDPITSHPSLLEEMPESEHRTPVPIHSDLAQKDATISFSYRAPAPKDDDKLRLQRVSDAITSALEGYANAGGLVTFAVTEQDGIFHIVPTNFLNKDGQMQSMPPVLDAKITILPGQRTRFDLFREICAAVTKASGQSVTEGPFPFNPGSLQANASTTISGTDVTARSLLVKLLAELSSPLSGEVLTDDGQGHRATQTRVIAPAIPLSWKLFYAPGWGFVLNLHPVKISGE
jgi:hypothetical protein